MFKVTAFTAILPTIFVLYGFFAREGSIILNSAFTIFFIILLLLLQKKYMFKAGTYYSFIFFVLLSIFAGRTLSFYELIPNWDKLLHFISGFIFAQTGKEIYIKMQGDMKNKLLLNSFSLIFASSAASLWEIWEFAGDKILKFNAQNNSLNDTMYDIILGTLSGIIKVFGADIIFRKLKKTI